MAKETITIKKEEIKPRYLPSRPGQIIPDKTKYSRKKKHKKKYEKEE